MKDNPFFVNNFGIFLSIIALAFVVPYASNAMVVLLFLSLIGKWDIKKTEVKFLELIKTTFAIGGACLIVLGLISAFWSPSTSNSIFLSIRLFLIFVCGILLVAAIDSLSFSKAEKLRFLVIGATLMMMLFYIIDLATNGSLATIIKGYPQTTLTKIGRGAAVLSLIVWPVALMIYRQSHNLVLSVSFVLLVMIVIFLLPMRAAPIAVVFGLGVFLLVLLLKRYAVIFVFMAMMVSYVVAPFVSLKLVNPATMNFETSSLPSSWKHRIAIWEYASSKTLAYPIKGHGMEASREIGKNAPTVMLPIGSNRTEVSVLPLHPHNAAIQIWLELGALGIVVICFVIFGFMKVVLSYLDRPCVASTMSAVMASTFFIASFSFGSWQNWWVASVMLAIGLMKLASKDITPEKA